MSIALRWYQEESVAATWAYLCANPGANPVVCLPTGAGKSVVIAQLCREAVEKWQGRVMILAHRKELLEQNAAKVRALCPGLDVGLYSAGLRARDTEHTIVCAGIQSVYRRAHEFGLRHLVIIDETHLVPFDGEGMYRQFIDDLRSLCPYVRMVGLTATPYRLDSGPLCRPDGLFQKTCYSAPVRQLIAEGFLCDLTTTAAGTAVDTSRLHLRGGEFVAAEMESAFNSVVVPACREIVNRATQRESILVFCSGVDHAAKVREYLANLTGEEVGMVTGETLDLERAATLAAFKERRIRWCVNVDVLTTGFDAPNIDCIAVLRATMSPGLFYQIVGRGFRVSPTKKDCLILDFGGNITRHGPIDAPDYGVQDKKNQSSAGDAPTKQCPACEHVCLLGDRECPKCGFKFPEREASHEATAENGPILTTPETWTVDKVYYYVHWKRVRQPDDVPTMRVDYRVYREGGTPSMTNPIISEWICIQHRGYARQKAEKWWKERSDAPFPDSVERAVQLCQRGAVAEPRNITCQKDGRWWRILRADLYEKPDLLAIDQERQDAEGGFAELELEPALDELLF